MWEFALRLCSLAVLRLWSLRTSVPILHLLTLTVFKHLLSIVSQILNCVNALVGAFSGQCKTSRMSVESSSWVTLALLLTVCPSSRLVLMLVQQSSQSEDWNMSAMNVKTYLDRQKRPIVSARVQIWEMLWKTEIGITLKCLLFVLMISTKRRVSVC